MGASYPIIHSGFRCRRSDPDAHQCLLVVGWHRATARTADLRRHPPCGIPKSSIQLTGFAIEVDPKSNMGLAACPLWVKSGHLQRKIECLLYPPKADSCTAQAHVRFGPKADIEALRGCCE